MSYRKNKTTPPPYDEDYNFYRDLDGEEGGDAIDMTKIMKRSDLPFKSIEG